MRVEPVGTSSAQAPDAAARLRAIVTLQREIGALVGGDRDALLQLVAEHSLAAFPNATGSLVSFLRGEQLVVEATAGTTVAALGFEIDQRRALTGRALRTGETLFSGDAMRDPDVDHDFAASIDMASVVAAPLKVGGRAVGGLTMSSIRTGAFDQTDAEQLTLFADALSGALRHLSDSARYAEQYERARTALAAVEESEARVRATFDASPLGVAVLTLAADGARVVEVNHALAEIFGCLADQLVDRPLADLLDVDVAQACAENPDRTATLTRACRRSDGSEVWTRWHLAPLPPTARGEQQVLAQVDDITGRRAAVHQLRRQARLLDLIPQPIIIRSLDGTIRYWNAGAAETYGHATDDVVGTRTHDLLATRFHGITLPELEAQLGAGGVWSGTLEHRHADGRTLRMLSRHVRDDHDDGEPVILEVNIDVSEHYAAEQALAASEAKFRSQFANSTVGQFIRTPDGILEDVNPAMAAMLGYDVRDLVGTNVARLFDPGMVEQRGAMLAALRRGDADAVNGEGAMVRADGSLLEVELNLSVVRNVAGAVERVVGIFQDITARKAAEDALHHRALHDPLTGLANRTLLTDRLGKSLLASRRSDRTVGLLFLDLDGFKVVNDVFGHDVGDALLIEVAARLEQCVRGGDTVARLGGDEFVVLCPDLETAQAMQPVADRALARLSAPYSVGGERISTVSASIGMTFPSAQADPQQALREADQAMYQVKRSGKNRVGTAGADRAMPLSA